MRHIPPFSRSIFKNPYQIVSPNTGLRYEESRLLREAAEKRRIKLCCLLCDTALSFADPECSTCGATTDILLYSNPDGSYTVMPYLWDAEMTASLLKKAVGLGHPHCCLSCNQSLGREGECQLCQSKTYYVKPHNDTDACSLLPELCLIEHYVRQPNEVDLRMLGVAPQAENDTPVKDVREVLPAEPNLAVETPATQSRSSSPSVTEAGEVSTSQPKQLTPKEMVSQFLSESVVESRDAITPRRFFYDAYLLWMSEQDSQALADKTFYKCLYETFPEATRGQNRIKGLKGLTWCMRGLKLRPDAEV